jgi:spermidine/putrescine transport system substrate-binding protein
MIIALSILSPLLGGCGKGTNEDRLLITIIDEDDSPPPDESPGGVETPLPTGDDAVINIVCWEGHFPRDLLDTFESETGIAVEISPPPEPFDPMVFFSEQSDEYDLVLVDDLIVGELKNQGYLARLDPANVTHLDYIDPLFLQHPTDEGRSFSVPITWGTLGILVNRNLVAETDIGWDILFDPRYSGLIDMPPEHFLLLVPALKALGYSINERDPEVLEEAQDLLIDQKQIIHGYYDHDTIVRHLVEGSSAVAFAWSWMGMYAVDMGGNVEYVVPTSGTLIVSDCLVIPAGSSHIPEAEAFLDFLLIPDNMTRISEHLWTANTVPASWNGVNPALRDMEGVFLPEQTRFNSEYLEPFGPEFEEEMMGFFDELFETDGMDDI